MPVNSRVQVFKALRQKHPVLIYESFNIVNQPEGIRVSFEFKLSGDITFKPGLFIPFPKSGYATLNENELQNLVFHIGMVELISYWKAACPPEIVIKPYRLSVDQQQFWKKLWFFGLGEFFYTNGIEVEEGELFQFSFSDGPSLTPIDFVPNSKTLVPVGGGKDSVVTLELLKNAGTEIVPFILNPRPASIKSALKAGFQETDIFVVQRTLDRQLIDLNSKGYLNGHTPFSALLAFVTLFVARLGGAGSIALSNESSANEPTIPGTKINHQYSKSVEFESDFRKYVEKNISTEFNYFSFLRPLNELQIAKLFSGFPHHYETFRSCNVGSKTDSWCGSCPKCLFTRIILGPFISPDILARVFGRELLDDPELQTTFDELTGMADEKPFECVGTVDEVNGAIGIMLVKSQIEELPYLLKYYRDRKGDLIQSFENLLRQMNDHHFLRSGFEQIIKSAIA